MSRIFSAAGLLVTLLASGAATTAERTVALAVDGMSCPSCPYIVRTVLEEVPGVARAEVSYAAKTAVVTFEDTRSDVAALTQATAGVGFPSRVIGVGDK
jgi:mercuric ion binding protein